MHERQIWFLWVKSSVSECSANDSQRRAGCGTLPTRGIAAKLVVSAANPVLDAD